jgi:exonuclease SbcC
LRIEILQLENIRSHEKSTVPFTKGFNCLVGGLGCGKSSTLYAIDFALFGDPIGRSYEYLLREGTDSGNVTVQFVHNGKTYVIRRGLKRRGKGIGQDLDQLRLFEDENLVASLKSEAVADQIKAITGLDKELFREIVWVRQEHLKELLDAAPRERQKRLDELFGLSDYETAWSSIAEYQKEYEGERRAHEKDPDVAGMEKLGTEYERTAEEFGRVEIDLQQIGKDLDETRETLEKTETDLRKMEEIKLQLDELNLKEVQTLANLNNAENLTRSLGEKIKAKEEHVGSFRQRLDALEKQTESYKAELKSIGISPDLSLEELRSYLATFDDHISSLKGEQEATLKGMRDDQKRVSSLSTENRCPLCLQRMSDEYKNGLIDRIQQENSERQKIVARVESEIRSLQQTKSKASNIVSSLQISTQRGEDLNGRINDESQALAELQKELRQKHELEKELVQRLDVVRAEISRLDVSQLESAKDARDQAQRHFYDVQSDYRAKEDSKKYLVKRLDEIKERIDQAQQKIERMQKIVKMSDMIVGIRDAYRSIQPKLRSEFVKVLRNFVQQVLDNLVGGEGQFLNVLIDENYSPYVKSEGGVEREVSNLSGGERTLLAFAYRLGLGQLIMQSRTGHGLSMLLLDEPTESLGREDGSIDRLAEAISRIKAVEQIIAVTHSEAFAEKAEHVIRLEKEAGISKVSLER